MLPQKERNEMIPRHPGGRKLFSEFFFFAHHLSYEAAMNRRKLIRVKHSDKPLKNLELIMNAGLQGRERARKQEKPNRK